jgi:TIR domain
MQPTKPEVSIKVFVSYARADREFCRKLEDHLSPLKYSGKITIWQDQEIPAGADWEDQIHAHLNDADMILLLISSSFIASKYCWNKEVQTALERHKAGIARVIPILLKPALWQDTPLGQLQVLPTEAKPITQWHDQDAAFEDVARGIQKVVEHLRIKLREEALRNEKIGMLTDKIADLYQSFILTTKSVSEIESKVSEQNERKKELEEELRIVNASIEEIKVQQRASREELFQLKEQLKETSEQLVNLGGELDPLTSLALAPPFHHWMGSSTQKEARNLDFAKGMQSWFLTGDAPANYVYGIDPTLTLNGKACAYLKSRDDLSVGFGTLAQAFQGAEYCGKRLRLSGLVKAQEIEQWAGLWMRIDGDGGKQLGFDNMYNRAIRGTIDVKRYEIVLNVPTESVGIYFGVVLTGSGQVWLSDIQLVMVGTDVPTTGK